jgi:meso-butanediol dehydrogenase/(S,S)-butanediol dehydrogenase/diacetyl reductase
MRLKDKVALITGGGAGIGAKIAERFVAEGAKVCICDIQPEALDRMKAKFPPETVTISHGDVTQPEDVREMVGQTVEFGGKIDILVNNAAVDAKGKVVDMDTGQWQKVLDTNVNGAFLTAKAAIPEMIKAGGGAIVNISALAGIRCLPEMPAYCTSKGALISLTQQIALDYGPSRIRCNAICPGPVKAGLLEAGTTAYAEETGRDVEEIFEQLTENIPLRRIADPEEVAAACVFLASDEASYITGSTLMVDGGLAMVDAFGLTLKKTAGFH